jgi:hypothetical protein
MKAGQSERLQESLTRLRLFKSRERLEALLQGGDTSEHSLRRHGHEKARTYAGLWTLLDSLGCLCGALGLSRIAHVTY